jgi:hypothetical protein
MDFGTQAQSVQPNQTGLTGQWLTFSSVLSILFYLLTLVVIGYYLWNWWQNTQRLKKSLTQLITHATKEGFTGDETDTLQLEKPVATQAKVPCKQTSTTHVTGIWDAEDDGYVLFEEPPRKWTATKLGQTEYSPAVDNALDELKKKYHGLITETTKEMLVALDKAGLSEYLKILEDLDQIVSANSQIAQLKGMMLTQTEQLGRIKNTLNILNGFSYNNGLLSTLDGKGEYIPVADQSEMSREELGRQLIRNRILREYLEKHMAESELVTNSDISIGTTIYQYIIENPPITKGLVELCDKLISEYKILLPRVDEVISKRSKYEKEKQEIIELVDILPDANTRSQSSSANGRYGGWAQVPDGVLGSDSTTRSPTSDRWPQRYYLNKQSAYSFETTKNLDMLRSKIKNPPGGITRDEYVAKYNWVDRVGKDQLPVPDDPEIKYSLPVGMQRTIPDIISDFDHNNANCQRIYGECSTRTDVPGFPLPNWDTADYYGYLDRLPDAKQAADGQIPVI